MARFPLSGDAVLRTTSTAATDSFRAGLRLSATEVVVAEASVTAGSVSVVCNGLPFVGDALQLYVVDPLPVPDRLTYCGGLPYTDGGALVATTSAAANFVNGVPMSSAGFVVVA